MAASSTTGIGTPAPAAEHVLERAGCRRRYWLAGPEDRPLVVLSHGMALDHRMFDAQARALAGDYRVLAWDLRGHGRSQPAGAPLTVAALVDDLLAILYQVGRQRAAIVGHSLGGIVAQELAFRFPARVSALATFGCSCITLPAPAPQALANRYASIPLRVLRHVPHWPLLRLSVALMAERPETRAQAAEMASRITPAVFLQTLAALATSMHPEPNYRFEQPLLIAYGARDRYGRPQRAARAWAARDTQAQVVAIPGAGHNANQDNPAAFNDALLDFLGQALGDRTS